MRKHILSLVLLSFAYCAHAQTYISFVPSITNSAGTLAEKSNFSFEIGRQWDVFSLGLDIGKSNLARVAGRDTATYLEIRPNLNIFQQGRFTNTLTPGIGYIFNGKEDLVTEVTSGIEYTCTSTLHFNIYFGQYFYSGKVSASNVTFFGLSVMLYFKPAKTGALISNKGKAN